MSECPDERAETEQGILEEMSIKAQQELGVERGARARSPSAADSQDRIGSGPGGPS